MKFTRFLLLSVFFFTTACTTVSDDLSMTSTTITNNLIEFDVSSIEIEEMHQLNSFCEDIAVIAPKDALRNWFKNNLRAVGKNGVLSIKVNSAVLHKVPTDIEKDKYNAMLDVTFKISRSDEKGTKTSEMKVIAENYRVMSDALSSKEKREILHTQVKELIRLFELETMASANSYLPEYIKRTTVENEIGV